MSDEVIVSTKDRPGSYDAIETAKPDEPLFPIQGGDPFGPKTVLHWAKLAREAALQEADQKLSVRLLRKAADAEQVAWQMQEYQRGHAAPEGDGRARYNDVVPEIEDTAARSEREARIKGAERLNDAVGRIVAVAEALEGAGYTRDEVLALHGFAGLVKNAAAQIEPRRGNERS